MDNTTKDVSRSIARLDKHAAAGPGDVVDVDGANWTGEDLRATVAYNLAYQSRNVVRLSKVTRRDVGLMMASHGASAFTINRHARAIAAMMRADIALHTWGASL